MNIVNGDENEDENKRIVVDKVITVSMISTEQRFYLIVSNIYYKSEECIIIMRQIETVQPECEFLVLYWMCIFLQYVCSMTEAGVKITNSVLNFYISHSSD